MLNESQAFSGFSVNDMSKAKEFYGQTLGLDVEETPMGLSIKTLGNNDIFAYPKEDHIPATFTILNFIVEDIDKTIDRLADKGVTFEHYNNMPAKQDEKGVLRGRAAGMGPDIAWFKDPAGNILALLQN
jgi:catechol 2,3-dioxygenase-like lactoylglutathione lyase family enzyme